MLFLTIEQVIAIHERVLAAHGGSPGLRDHGLLDAATAVPQSTFGGQLLHPDVESAAAAYLYHLCKNHAFMDGNKRVGLAAALTFLLLNDCRLVAELDDVEKLVLGCADGSLSKGEVIEFFRQHVEPDQ